MHPTKTLALSLALSASFSSCAPHHSSSIKDPLEPFNRYLFEVHTLLDTLIFRPAAEVYQGLVPKFFRQRLSNVADLIASPLYSFYNLLQGDFKGAANSIIRFFINATLGVAGLFDPASKLGFPKNPENLSQTLAAHGVPPGPYLFIPGFGPSSFRDAASLFGGTYVTSQQDSLLSYNDRKTLSNVRFALTIPNVLQVRGDLISILDGVEQNSVDFYASLRNLYIQNINNSVFDGNIPEELSLPPLTDVDSNFNFDDDNDDFNFDDDSFDDDSFDDDDASFNDRSFRLNSMETVSLLPIRPSQLRSPRENSPPTRPHTRRRPRPRFPHRAAQRRRSIAQPRGRQAQRRLFRRKYRR